MLQLIFHLTGDYVTQSDWMAQNKTKNSLAAFWHALIYSLPFLLITHGRFACSIIFVTHFFIDRFRIARYVVYAKNIIFAPPGAWKNWEDCSATGYYKDAPVWLAVWLMILCDNTIHLAINYLAIKYA